MIPYKQDAIIQSTNLGLSLGTESGTRPMSAMQKNKAGKDAEWEDVFAWRSEKGTS